MVEGKSIKYISTQVHQKRDGELLESTKLDKEILTIEQGKLTSKKSSLPNTSTSDTLKLSNCFLRRALALDLAQVTSFTNQLLMSQLSVRTPVGYAPASLQQIIQADKFFWSKLAERVGIDVSPATVDPFVQELMNDPDFSLHLLPRPEVSQPATSPKPAASTSFGKGQGDRDRPRVDRRWSIQGKKPQGRQRQSEDQGGFGQHASSSTRLECKDKRGQTEMLRFQPSTWLPTQRHRLPEGAPAV